MVVQTTRVALGQKVLVRGASADAALLQVQPCNTVLMIHSSGMQGWSGKGPPKIKILKTRPFPKNGKDKGIMPSFWVI